MKEEHPMSPCEYTDEEMLHTVQALTRQGHGTRTLAAHDHTITAMEELNRHRKVPRAGRHAASGRSRSSWAIRQRTPG